jgi:hypothetical protein
MNDTMMNIWELKNRTKELITLCIKLKDEAPNDELLQGLVDKSLPVLECYLKKFEKFT